MKKITIVGVGALGSHLVPLIRNSESTIKIVDFDRIEQKNILSQFHSKTSVGSLKVQGLKQLTNHLYGMKLDAISHKLISDNVEQILSGSDLIVDCLDNGEARTLVQNFVRKNHIPCLHGALAANGAIGCIFWDENFTVDSEAGQGAATCEDGEHLPFISIVSSLMAKSICDFLKTGKKKGFIAYPTGMVSLV
jgi:tRNA A37 threonylcarbamoyladenosine dehydratase